MKAIRVLAVSTLLGASALACGSAQSVTPPPIQEEDCPEPIEDASEPVPAPPVGEDECASGVCNYQTQAGCAASQACRPQFDAESPSVAPGCEAAGEGKAGADCKAQADCARGFYCDPTGTCRKLFCGGDWSACDAGESCIRSLLVRAGGKVISAGTDLCYPVGTCDPFDSDGCKDDPARECKVVDPTGAVACAPRSNKDVGDACGPPDVCKQGLACVGGVCVKLCVFSACGEPSCAPEDGTCVHYQRDPAGIGECIQR